MSYRVSVKKSPKNRTLNYALTEKETFIIITDIDFLYQFYLYKDLMGIYQISLYRKLMRIVTYREFCFIYSLSPLGARQERKHRQLMLKHCIISILFLGDTFFTGTRYTNLYGIQERLKGFSLVP